MVRRAQTAEPRQGQPDGTVELGCLMKTPVGSEDCGIAAPVVGIDKSQDVPERGEEVDLLEHVTDEFVEDRRAFPGRAVPVGERSDAAGRVHGGFLAGGGEVDRRGRGPHQGAVSRCSLVDLEMDRSSEVPGHAVGQDVFGLQADVLRNHAPVAGIPVSRPVSDVRN